MAAEKYYVYQQVFLQGLQEVVDNTFNIVIPENLEKFRNQIVAICAPGGSELSTIDGKLIESLPSLKVISVFGVGYDYVDVATAINCGVRIGHTPYVLDNATADMAMSLLLGSARRIVEGALIAKTPSTPKYHGKVVLDLEVSESTIGIVGMGRIGTKIAKRALGFGMKILYHNRRQKSAEEESKLCAVYAPVLNDMLEQCDFVVLVAPSTKETYRMIGREQFRAMKKTGVFINVARGALVDHDALVAALKDGEIAHAGLDVTDPEPLPRDHPLLAMSNVTLTPHIGSATYSTRKKMLDVTIGNIFAGIKGEELISEVPETKK